MKYKMKIIPAINAEERHLIEDYLEKIGFIVHGGGQMIDGSECDITFDDSNLNFHKIISNA